MDAVTVPEVPVMVMVDVPGTAVVPAVNVIALVPVVGLVSKVAATPLGNALVARVTLPSNEADGFTVMVAVAVPP